MTKCGNPNCDQYPYYGMAPHKHKGVQWDVPRTILGSTVIEPKESWPRNFTEDPECPGLGVWSCPECGVIEKEKICKSQV
jgi:hypothetical protein